MEALVFPAALVSSAIMFVFAVWSFAMMVRSSLRMVSRIRSDAPIAKGLWLNPFNTIWRPKYLTEEGKQERLELIRWAVAFAASISVASMCALYINSFVNS